VTAAVFMGEQPSSGFNRLLDRADARIDENAQRFSRQRSAGAGCWCATPQRLLV
jgi:hypothetical protein